MSPELVKYLCIGLVVLLVVLSFSGAIFKFILIKTKRKKKINSEEGGEDKQEGSFEKD